MTKTDLLNIADLEEGDLPEDLDSPSYGDWLQLFQEVSQNLSSITDSENTAGRVKDYLFSCLEDEGKREGETYHLIRHWYESSRAVSQKKKRIKRRRPNSALSRAAKRRWSKNRSKYKQGIQKYHSSTKGKKFHKNLARRLRRSFSESYQPTDTDILEAAKAVSSGMTHLIIEYDKRRERSMQREDVELVQAASELSRHIISELMEALHVDESRDDMYRDAVTLAGELFVDASLENDFSDTITEQEAAEDWDMTVTVPKEEEEDMMSQYGDQYDTVKKKDLGDKVKLMFRNEGI